MYFEEATKENKYCKAMDEKIDAIERNETWELTELPPKKQVIGVKWVYKTKCNAERKIYRHKARLVVKGYKQRMKEIMMRPMPLLQKWKPCVLS